MDERQITVLADGTMVFAYDDSLSPLRHEGQLERTERVSTIEPVSGGWLARFDPASGGQELGPVPTRAQALELERRWLVTEPGRRAMVDFAERRRPTPMRRRSGWRWAGRFETAFWLVATVYVLVCLRGALAR